SPFGNGWSLADHAALLLYDVPAPPPEPDLQGAMWIDDTTGTTRVFPYDGSSGRYLSPANDFGSLVAIPGGFTYTAQHQSRWNFEGGGNLPSRIDQHGLITTYPPRGGGSSPPLSIQGPDGGLATFTYDPTSGLLQTITAPGNRRVTFAYDGVGNLT